MKNIIIALCVSITFSQYFNPPMFTNSIFLNNEIEEDSDIKGDSAKVDINMGIHVPSGFAGNFLLIGQFPKGEFKDEGVPAGIGFDLNGMYYFVDELAIGLNLGGSSYGNSKRYIPFNYFTDLLTITEKTSNSMGYGHLFIRIVPFQGKIRPYIEGLIGFKTLITETTLYNENCTDDPDTNHDDCEIASSTNAQDSAISYGPGAGIEVTLLENKDIGGRLSFLFGFKYIWGGETDYLKEDSIEFSNPEDGPVETTFNWSTSKTDLMQIGIGLNFNF